MPISASTRVLLVNYGDKVWAPVDKFVNIQKYNQVEEFTHLLVARKVNTVGERVVQIILWMGTIVTLGLYPLLVYGILKLATIITPGNQNYRLAKKMIDAYQKFHFIPDDVQEIIRLTNVEEITKYLKFQEDNKAQMDICAETTVAYAYHVADWFFFALNPEEYGKFAKAAIDEIQKTTEFNKLTEDKQTLLITHLRTAFSSAISHNFAKWVLQRATGADFSNIDDLFKQVNQDCKAYLGENQIIEKVLKELDATEFSKKRAAITRLTRLDLQAISGISKNQSCIRPEEDPEAVVEYHQVIVETGKVLEKIKTEFEKCGTVLPFEMPPEDFDHTVPIREFENVLMSVLKAQAVGSKIVGAIEEAFKNLHKEEMEGSISKILEAYEKSVEKRKLENSEDLVMKKLPQDEEVFQHNRHQLILLLTKGRLPSLMNLEEQRRDDLNAPSVKPTDAAGDLSQIQLERSAAAPP